jgi:hypothetical protein
MERNGVKEDARDASKWKQYDVVVTLLTEKVRQPKEEIDTEEHKGLIIAPAAHIVACAIRSDLETDEAMNKLREYIKENNPEWNDEDFDLNPRWNDHMMTGYPPAEKILHISATGCVFPS